MQHVVLEGEWPLLVDGLLPLLVRGAAGHVCILVRAECPGLIGLVLALALVGLDRVCVLKLCVV